MTSRDFCYWLQGYFELSGGEETVPTDKKLMHYQVIQIKAHLAMVFKHEIDPSMGSKEHRDILDKIHLGVGDAKINC